jgi:hypothetical protein
MLAVRVGSRAEPASIVAALGIDSPRPALLVLGGAKQMTEGAAAACRRPFQYALVPVCETLGAAAIDGGTDVGVMKLLGVTHADANAGFPLIGVAPLGRVALPGTSRANGAADLEGHHTHAVLVEGDRWGDESRWLPALGSALSDGPPVAVLFNGGEVSLREVGEVLALGGTVFAVKGSGRAADRLVAAVRGGPADAGLAEVASMGGIEVVDLEPEGLAQQLETALNERGSR